MKVFLYILLSDKDGGHYIGISKDVQRRLSQHNSGLDRSTKHRAPFQLLTARAFDGYPEARRVEKILKKYSKEKIRKFINKIEINPDN